MSLARAFPTKDLGGLQSGATDGTRWPNRLDDKPTKEPKAPLYFCDYFCNYCAFFEGFPSGFSESPSLIRLHRITTSGITPTSLIFLLLLHPGLALPPSFVRQTKESLGYGCVTILRYLNMGIFYPFSQKYSHTCDRESKGENGFDYYSYPRVGG